MGFLILLLVSVPLVLGCLALWCFVLAVRVIFFVFVLVLRLLGVPFNR